MLTPDEDPELRDLADRANRQEASLQAWESAELHVLEVMLRERLDQLGVVVTAEIGAALMAVAQLLAERAPAQGGDARGTLAEVAVIGLRLLEQDLG